MCRNFGGKSALVYRVAKNTARNSASFNDESLFCRSFLQSTQNRSTRKFFSHMTSFLSNQIFEETCAYVKKHVLTTVFFSALLISNVFSKSGSIYAQETTRVETLIVASSKANERLRVILDDVRPGEKMKIAAVIRNACTDAFSVKEVKTSCACTQATLDSNEVLAGESVTGTFTLAFEKRPPSLRQAMGVTLVCKGCKDMIHIDFLATFSQTLVFAYPDSYFGFDGNQNRIEKVVRLLVSKDIDPKKVTVKVDDALFFVDMAYADRPDGPIVTCSFNPMGLDREFYSGEVSIYYEGKVTSTHRIELAKLKPIAVLPNPVVFVPTLDPDFRREATTLIKIPTSVGEEIDFSSVVASVGSEKLDATAIKIGNGIFRVKVRTNANLSNASKIDWLVALSDGRKLETQSRCVLSN